MSERDCSREQMEQDRFAAARMFDAGKTQADVARHFAVSPVTASRWRNQYKSGGLSALRKRKPTGRPRWISMDKLTELMRGPEYNKGKHTTDSIAADIDSLFGVKYHPDHVCRLLYRIGMEHNGKRWVWTKQS